MSYLGSGQRGYVANEKMYGKVTFFKVHANSPSFSDSDPHASLFSQNVRTNIRTVHGESASREGRINSRVGTMLVPHNRIIAAVMPLRSEMQIPGGCTISVNALR